MIEKPTREQILEQEKRKRLCKLAINKQLDPLQKQIFALKLEITKQTLANSIEKIPNTILQKLDDVKKKLKKLSGLGWDDIRDEYHETIKKKIKQLRKEVNAIEIRLAALQCKEFIAVDKQEIELEDLTEDGQKQYQTRTKYESLELSKLQQLDLLTGQDSAQKKQVEALEKQMLVTLNTTLKAFTTPLNAITSAIPEISIPGFEDLTQLIQLIPILAEQLATAEETIEKQKNNSLVNDPNLSEAAKKSFNTAFKEVADMCEMPKLSPEFQKKLEDIDDAILAVTANIPGVIANALVIIVFYILNLKIPVVEMSLMDIAAGEPHIAQIVTLVKLVPQIPQLIVNLRPQVKKLIYKKLQSIQQLTDIATFLASGNVLDELNKAQVEASVDSCPLKEKQNVEAQCKAMRQEIKDLKKQLDDLKKEQQKIASVTIDSDDDADDKKDDEKAQDITALNKIAKNSFGKLV